MDLTMVRAASRGDVAAYASLVDASARFAAAVALARTGQPEIAEEVAQEAFLDAWRQLGTLREPAAFRGWLRRIVIKHADRVTRRKALPTVPLDHASPPTREPDPEMRVVSAEASRSVLAAVAALAPHQREVCALYYLSGHSQADIARLLSLSVPAIKKRLHDARRRLAPMLEDPVTWNLTSLPLRVRAFVAARAGRVDVLADALNADPELIDAPATLDPTSLETRYVPTLSGVPLLFAAVSYGHRDVVELLLDRGADLHYRSRFGHTALLVAVEQDHPDVVALLLDRGANPNDAMWHGGTALHTAARRQRKELYDLLVANGADPATLDRFGRAPADWKALRSGPDRTAPRGRVIDPHGHPLDDGPPLDVPARSAHPEDPRVRPTGVKALDLLAPLAMCGTHRLLAGPGVGKIVLIGELANRLGPTVVAGLLDRTWDVRDFEAVLRESGAWDRSVVVLGAGDTDHDAVARTALAHAEATGGWVVADDRLLGAMRRAGPGVSVVGFGPHVHPDPVPDASDVVAQWVLDPERARRREYPAVDPQHSQSRARVSERHASLAGRLRTALRGPEPMASRLRAWLTQPFQSVENFNGRPGEVVALADALDDAEALLEGAAAEIEASALLYRGRLDGAAWPTVEGSPF